MNLMKSKRILPPDDRFMEPHFPDNVWLNILGYLANDNAKYLLDISRYLSEHPLGRISQDYR